MNATQEHRFYRSRNGAIAGVCRGLAEHFGLSVLGVRIAVILIACFTAVLPVMGIYALLAIIMKPEPVIPLRSHADEEFYDSYVSSRSQAWRRLKATFDKLDHRLQRLEHVITSSEYNWERRLNSDR